MARDDRLENSVEKAQQQNAQDEAAQPDERPSGMEGVRPPGPSLNQPEGKGAPREPQAEPQDFFKHSFDFYPDGMVR